MPTVTSPEHFMPKLRVRDIPVYAMCMAAALGTLAGCASSRLSLAPPPGVRLAGDWKLDSARSDHLGKALQQLREQSERTRREMRNGKTAGGSEGPPTGRRAPRAGKPDGQQGGEAGQNEGPALGPAPHVSATAELMVSVPQGNYLGIRVTADSFTVISGDSSNQYTPGLESEISAERGDARQISGWKGADYVIETQPQWGPRILQSYSLAKDGGLVMTVHLSGGRTDFTFTRVYERTTRVAPLAPPSLN